MSRNRRRNRSEEWLYIVELICLDEMDHPTIFRGYIRGFDCRELEAESVRWNEVKVKGLRDENPRTDFCPLIRRRKVNELVRPVNLAGVEDIRSFFELHDTQLVVPQELEYFEEQMKGFNLNPNTTGTP